MENEQGIQPSNRQILQALFRVFVYAADEFARLLGKKRIRYEDVEE